MIRTVPARLAAALVIAPSWAIGAAMLVKGHAESGDGFSAGLTAGAGILIHHLVFGREETRRLGVVRLSPWLVQGGLLLVLGTVFFPLATGKPPVTHVPEPGTSPTSLGMLQLHSALAFDVGVFAIVLGFTLGTLELMAGFADRSSRGER